MSWWWTLLQVAGGAMTAPLLPAYPPPATAAPLPVTAAPLPAYPPPGQAPAQADVVVTGHRLEDTRAALAACLARHCPPQEEIAAATAHGVAQFLAGDYDGARGTLGHTAGRTKRYAKELPTQVSGILALHGAVAAMTGYGDTGRIRPMDAVDALKAGLPPGDRRIGVAEIAVAAAFAKEGRFYDAVGLYDGTAARAAAAHQGDVQGRAMLGAAMLYASAASVDASYEPEARKRLAALNATADPALRPYREATVALRGRLASRAGNKRELAAVLAQAATMRASEALLIVDPVVDSSDIFGTGTAQDPLIVETRDQWATLAFRVAPDGSVRDVAVRAKGHGADAHWLTVMTRAVARRRYLPLDLPPDAPGLVRVERFSLVADLATTERSHIRQHIGTPRFEITDLTPAPEAGSSPGG